MPSSRVGASQTCHPHKVWIYPIFQDQPLQMELDLPRAIFVVLILFSGAEKQPSVSIEIFSLRQDDSSVRAKAHTSMDGPGPNLRPSRRGRTGWYAKSLQVDSEREQTLIFAMSSSMTCRRRHLKCDEEKPACGRCRRTRRECIPDDHITFRNSQRVAAKGQIDCTSQKVKKNRVHRDSNDVFGINQIWVETPPFCGYQSASSKPSLIVLVSVIHRRDLPCGC